MTYWQNEATEAKAAMEAAYARVQDAQERNDRKAENKAWRDMRAARERDNRARAMMMQQK